MVRNFQYIHTSLTPQLSFSSLNLTMAIVKACRLLARCASSSINQTARMRARVRVSKNSKLTFPEVLLQSRWTPLRLAIRAPAVAWVRHLAQTNLPGNGLLSTTPFSFIDCVEDSNYGSWKPEGWRRGRYMNCTSLNSTWYDYHLQFSRDVPWHFANEIPISANNRHSHPFAVLPIFPSHSPYSYVHESRCPCTLPRHLFNAEQWRRTFDLKYAPHHHFIWGWGNTPDGISKGSPGISEPFSEKKFVVALNSLPNFPRRECRANLHKTCDDLILLAVRWVRRLLGSWILISSWPQWARFPKINIHVTLVLRTVFPCVSYLGKPVFYDITRIIDVCRKRVLFSVHLLNFRRSVKISSPSVDSRKKIPKSIK